ncbi:MAG: OmpA family protein [Pseudomonadota bacterium]|nr:OmpA family protein [Pseudomonadota bacterium]
MHGLMLLLPLASGPAHAQDAVSMQVVKAGQLGTSAPALVLVLNQDAAALTVKLDCGGTRVGHDGAARAGERVELKIDAPAGTHACRGSLFGSFADGSEGEMPLAFTVTVHRPMAMALRAGSLDLDKHSLDVVLDRATSKVEITALGPKGVQVGYGLAPIGAAANTPVNVEWKQDGGEVIKLLIRGFDTDGFWSELELVPWSYSIPHEDVVFATNASDIGATEVPKLATAMTDARAVLDKYGADVIIKLYVGGHTDTVGDGSSNQKLSMARARAIAAWFKKSGFPGQIYYQGYGEGSLAVETGDEVDEPRNRRASYTLAARPPEASGGGGDYGWQELK